MRWSCGSRAPSRRRRPRPQPQLHNAPKRRAQAGRVTDHDRPPPGPGVILGPHRGRTLSVPICRVAVTPKLCSNKADPEHAVCRNKAAPCFPVHPTRRAIGARHQGAQNRIMLHQPSQIPGSGDSLPKFLPKQAVKRSRDDISAGHGRKLEWPTGVCHQPSKLVMRVRFPSPAHRRSLRRAVPRHSNGHDPHWLQGFPDRVMPPAPSGPGWRHRKQDRPNADPRTRPPARRMSRLCAGRPARAEPAFRGSTSATATRPPAGGGG
jgi:hypothetical protein